MPATNSVEPSDSSEPSASCPDWDERDWEDYNYDPRAAAGGAGGVRRDPLANLLDGLPGLDADEISAMIRDLPMPNTVEVPGLTVEEAIEV